MSDRNPIEGLLALAPGETVKVVMAPKEDVAKRTVYVLFYYTDGDAGDVVGVYSTEERAEEEKRKHRYPHDCQVWERKVDE